MLSACLLLGFGFHIHSLEEAVLHPCANRPGQLALRLHTAVSLGSRLQQMCFLRSLDALRTSQVRLEGVIRCADLLLSCQNIIEQVVFIINLVGYVSIV